MKLRALRWGDDAGLSRRAQRNHKDPYKGACGVREGLKDAVRLALKMEEGPRAKAASRGWKEAREQILP